MRTYLKNTPQSFFRERLRQNVVHACQRAINISLFEVVSQNRKREEGRTRPNIGHHVVRLHVARHRNYRREVIELPD